MKLRIKGNSIRLRLGQSEVRRLATDGAVEEFTAFGPTDEQRFVYAICASSEEPGVSASFSDRRMVIRVPESVIHSWITTDQVSIEALQRTGSSDDLRILIEKDFAFIEAPADESQDDAFPNPQLAAACTAGAIAPSGDVAAI
jgi:hypothetical protein